MRFLLSVFLGFITINLAYSATNKISQEKKFPVAYTINIEKEVLKDGTILEPRVYKIDRLPKDMYLPNTIYLKTKNPELIASNLKGFYSNTLSMDLEPFQIESIKAPFEYVASVNVKKVNPGIQRTASQIYEIKYSSSVDPYDLCKLLIDNPDVEYAVPVFKREMYDYTPNDPRFTSQPYLNRMQAKKAWDITKGSKDVIIAIVDSGVDIDHEDLKANIWVNDGEVPGDGIDNDKNGFVDDVNGWDFVGNASIQQAMSGIYNPDNNPRPGNLHGTHVAGCAAAIGDNNKGIAGIGFNSTIMALKHGLDANYSGIFKGYDGILYAAKMGADVINCSWGGPGYSPAEQDVIDMANEMGAVVVVASGNDGNNLDDDYQYPAAYNNVLSVGATDNSDRWASFANYGMKVTVYAPGSNIFSTVPNNGYGNQSGTSMASPIVAGVAALVKSLRPDWTPAQIIHHIRSTSDPLANIPDNAKPLFFGRVNAYKAVTKDIKGDPINFSHGVGILQESLNDVLLDDFKAQLVNVTIKNYLSPVGNLKVTVTPIDNFIKITNPEFTFPGMPTDGTKELALQIQLLDNNPWFRGDARFLVTYEAENYLDYELLKFEIKLPSDNQFRVDYKMPDYLPVVWTDAHSPDPNTFFAAGDSPYGGVYYNNKFTGKVAQIQQNGPPLYTVFSADGQTIYYGGGETNQAIIYKSSNSGNNWSSKNISSITGFINKVWFFDGQTGVALGDPLSNSWGIARTVDAGNNWSKVTGTPSVTASETGWVGSVAFYGDNAWFGTTQGNILHSSDKGASWSKSTLFQGGHVTLLGFMSPDSGIAVYYEKQDLEPPQKLAFTTDGGKTWKTNIYNFTEKQMYPVSIYHPKNSNLITMMFSNGEIFRTTNLGKAWEPVLSQKYGQVRIGAGAAFGNKATYWGIHKVITSLTFEFPLENMIKKITVNEDVNNVIFDSVEVGASTIEKVAVENTGNVTINFSDIKIEGPDADNFTFIFGKPSTLEAGKSSNLNIRFSPDSERTFSAKLVILNDSDNPELEVNLTGYGKTVVSVNDSYSNDMDIKLYPNPASDLLNLNINNISSGEVIVKLYDESGRFIANCYNGVVPSEVIEIDLKNLMSGAYILQINTGSQLYYERFIINK